MKTFVTTSDATGVYRSTANANQLVLTSAVPDTLADQMRDAIVVFEDAEERIDLIMPKVDLR